jgi:hypothetical protein
MANIIIYANQATKHAFFALICQSWKALKVILRKGLMINIDAWDVLSYTANKIIIEIL